MACLEVVLSVVLVDVDVEGGTVDVAVELVDGVVVVVVGFTVSATEVDLSVLVPGVEGEYVDAKEVDGLIVDVVE